MGILRRDLESRVRHRRRLFSWRMSWDNFDAVFLANQIAFLHNCDFLMY